MYSNQSKREQIKEKVDGIFPKDLDNKEEVVEAFIDSFCKIREYPATLDIVLPGKPPVKSPVSVRPGNVILNWRKLFTSIPNITFTVAGAVADPLLWPFAALIIWNDIWSLLKLDLSRKHAAVMTALWNNRDENKIVQKNTGLQLTNDLLKQNNQPSISFDEYNQILLDLVHMGCIKEKENDKIWLREWVKKSIYP